MLYICYIISITEWISIPVAIREQKRRIEKLLQDDSFTAIVDDKLVNSNGNVYVSLTWVGNPAIVIILPKGEEG